MTGARLAAAAACTAAGVAFEPAAALIVPGLALALAATRSAARPAHAAAAGPVVMTAAFLPVAGGLVTTWPPAPLLAPLLALPFALPGLAHLVLRRAGGGRPDPGADAGFVAAWLLVEAALVHGAGLPFVRIGYALAPTPLVRLAGLAGAGAIGAGALAAAWALAELAAARDAAGLTRALRRALRPGLPLAAALLAASIGPPADGPPRELRVALIQTDVRAADGAARRGWPEARAALEVRALDLVRRAVGRGAELIIAPENTLHAVDPRDLPAVPTPPHAERFAVLVGARLGGDPGPRNAVVDLAAGGRVAHLKRRLVPWYERGLVPGTAAATLAVGDVSVVLAVCYDLLFAADLRAPAGTDLLVGVADAAFAGRSALPHLQLAVARVRAVESGRPVVFVTATGPSAILHPGGRATARTERLRSQVLLHDLTVGARPPPYARLGLEAEAYALLAGAGLAVRRGVRPLEAAIFARS